MLWLFPGLLFRNDVLQVNVGEQEQSVPEDLKERPLPHHQTCREYHDRTQSELSGKAMQSQPSHVTPPMRESRDSFDGETT